MFINHSFDLDLILIVELVAMLHGIFYNTVVIPRPPCGKFKFNWKPELSEDEEETEEPFCEECDDLVDVSETLNSLAFSPPADTPSPGGEQEDNNKKACLLEQPYSLPSPVAITGNDHSLLHNDNESADVACCWCWSISKGRTFRSQIGSWHPGFMHMDPLQSKFL
jgi:hypothetical protein